jgi:hypothetical protein
VSKKIRNNCIIIHKHFLKEKRKKKKAHPAVGMDKKTKRKRNKYVDYCRYKNIQKPVQELKMSTCTKVLCRSLLVFFSGLRRRALRRRSCGCPPHYLCCLFFVLKKEFSFRSFRVHAAQKIILLLMFILLLGCVGKGTAAPQKIFSISLCE